MPLPLSLPPVRNQFLSFILIQFALILFFKCIFVCIGHQFVYNKAKGIAVSISKLIWRLYRTSYIFCWPAYMSLSRPPVAAGNFVYPHCLNAPLVKVLVYQAHRLHTALALLY